YVPVLRPPRSALFPYTTLFRSHAAAEAAAGMLRARLLSPRIGGRAVRVAARARTVRDRSKLVHRAKAAVRDDAPADVAAARAAGRSTPLAAEAPLPVARLVATGSSRVAQVCL